MTAPSEHQWPDLPPAYEPPHVPTCPDPELGKNEPANLVIMASYMLASTPVASLNHTSDRLGIPHRFIQHQKDSNYLALLFDGFSSVDDDFNLTHLRLYRAKSKYVLPPQPVSTSTDFRMNQSDVIPLWRVTLRIAAISRI